MSSADRIAASRTVTASPGEVFRIIADPAMHVEIDGSGMLQAAPGAQRLEAPGDTFEMDMDRELLGDVPMGKYKALTTVTRIIPDRFLEWRNYCEWPNVPEKAREKFPIVPLAMLERSVESLVSPGSPPTGWGARTR